MNIYELGSVLDDPRLEGFGWELPGLTNEHGRTYDFTHFYPTSSDFTVPSLKRRWDYPEFTFQENVNPFNDFPCCDFHVPVFSKRAVGALRPFLEDNGELLPVRSKFGDFYAFQTLTVVHGALHHAKTKGLRLKSNPSYFLDIEKYFFRSTKLKDLKVFRILENPSCVLVTQAFVDIAEANRLLGFVFKPIWPHGAKVPKTISLKDKSLKKLTSQTLVIHLRLKGAKETPTETRKLLKLRAALSNELVLDDPQADYLGGLAGEIAADRWIMLLLACPDPRKLLKHLGPTLTSHGWSKEMRVSMRKAPYWDTTATDIPLTRNGESHG